MKEQDCNVISNPKVYTLNKFVVQDNTLNLRYMELSGQLNISAPEVSNALTCVDDVGAARVSRLIQRSLQGLSRRVTSACRRSLSAWSRALSARSHFALPLLLRILSMKVLYFVAAVVRVVNWLVLLLLLLL